MTLKQCVDFVNKVKPDHDFDNDTMTEWVNEVEGYVQTEVMLLDPVANLTRYTWTSNQNTELMVRPPHDKLYHSYLYAMIDFHNGEYDKYQNSMALYNAQMIEFAGWFIRNYHPADYPCCSGEDT